MLTIVLMTKMKTVAAVRRKNFPSNMLRTNPKTNNCHVNFSHLEEFICRQGRLLGDFSEQVVEAAHQKLDKIWQWYLVKMVEKEEHGDNFLRCINHYNSINI